MLDSFELEKRGGEGMLAPGLKYRYAVVQQQIQDHGTFSYQATY